MKTIYVICAYVEINGVPIKRWRTNRLLMVGSRNTKSDHGKLQLFDDLLVAVHCELASRFKEAEQFNLAIGYSVTKMYLDLSTIYLAI